MHRLTQEGLDRAAAVAGIPIGTLATISRVASLGGLPVEERQGSKFRLLVSSKELSALHTLVSRGYVRWGDNMTRAMLTDEGARRLDGALEEQARLLGRVRVAHPINRETGELREVTTTPKRARQNPRRGSRRSR